MLHRLRQYPVLTVVVVALGIRVAAAGGLQHVLDRVLHREFLIAGDANGYWTLAGHIVQGEPYALYDPPRRVMRMPGFPLLLAGGRFVSGDSFLFVRLLLAAVGAAACGLTCVLGRRLFGVEVGLIAGLYCACSPLLAGFSVLILSETAFAAAMLVSLLIAEPLLRREPTGGLRLADGGAAFGTGVATALATLVRPSWLPMAGVFAAAVLVRAKFRRSGWIMAGLVVLGTVVTLLPWAARNRAATGQWVWTTLWSGPSLYDGLNPGATGASDMRFFDRENVLRRMSEAEMNRHYADRAWRFALENPGRVLVLAVRKLGRFFSPWLNADAADHPMLRVVFTIFFLPLMSLAAWGAWVYRRRWPVLLLTLGPLLFFAAVHAVFIGSVRYRVPAEYPLSVLAAAGLWAVLGRRDSSCAKPQAGSVASTGGRP
jgi:4-amino-4-deoxy-L-arabinose transferase-like glycosyltransferase